MIVVVVIVIAINNNKIYTAVKSLLKLIFVYKE